MYLAINYENLLKLSRPATSAVSLPGYMTKASRVYCVAGGTLSELHSILLVALPCGSLLFRGDFVNPLNP